MSMMGHGIGILIIRKNGDHLMMDFWLDNEEYLELTGQRDLLSGISNTTQLMDRIPQGFKHPLEETEDIHSFLEAFDYFGTYAAFRKKVCKASLKSVEAVALMSILNQEFGEHRYRCHWVKYTLSSGAVTAGTETCESPSEAEACLKSLASAEGGTQGPALWEEAPERETEPAEVFDEEAFRRKMEEIGEQWLESYGSALERNPGISIPGKIFVLSGMEALGDEYGFSVEEEIEVRGGIVRNRVSGNTDYLVVDPRWAGASKIKSAMEQRQKGKPVKVILGTALMDLLATPEESADAIAQEQLPDNGGNVDFEIEDGVLIAYSGDAPHICIPEGVVRIDMDACAEKEALRSVTFPSTLREIGGGAFAYCTSLETLVFPEGLVSIGRSAFQGCGSLKRLGLPKSLRKIATSAFAKCEALETAELPEGVEEIQDWVFEQCGCLRTVTLPGTIRKMGRYLFSECECLECVVLGEGMEELGESSLYGCSNLRQIQFPQTLKVIGENALSGCEKLSDVILPDSIESLEPGMFAGYASLKKVRLPNKLREIPEKAFTLCTALEEIVVPVGVRTIGAKAFSFCENLKDIHISPFVKHMDDTAFLAVHRDALFHVIKGSYPERYCKEHGFAIDNRLDPELLRVVQAVVRTAKQRGLLP